MRFMAAIWDQGEADAKRTNTTWYSTEFPKMITGWRAAFKTPKLPFVYVELCHEEGAEEPKESDFWEYGQRAALKLPFVGFATTTDVDKVHKKRSILRLQLYIHKDPCCELLQQPLLFTLKPTWTSPRCTLPTSRISRLAWTSRSGGLRSAR